MSVAAAGVAWHSGGANHAGLDDIEWERHLHRVRPVVASAPRHQHDRPKAPRDDAALGAALATVTDPSAGSAGRRPFVHDRRFVDDVVAALESRVLCELERRGGRFREHR